MPPVIAEQSNSQRSPMPSARHVTALDGIRGIAVLLVMLLHYEVRRFNLGFPGARAVHAGISFGWAGVDLFFVLSGFLITGILLDAKERPFYFRNFYIRRTLRIFPVYYAFLLVIFVVLPLLHAAPATPASIQLWYWTYTTDFLVAIKGWAGTTLFAPHFWSLAIEEQFYLVWPLAILMLSRRQSQVLCAALVVSALGLRCWIGGAHGLLVASWVLPFTRMDTLAIGAFLALMVRWPSDFRSVVARFRPLGLILAVLLIGMIGWRGGPQGDRLVGTVGLSLVAVVFGWFVVEAYVAAPEARLARLLSNRPLVWLGRRSYAMYVVHHPIMTALTMVGFEVGPVRSVVGFSTGAHAVYVAVNVGLTALVAQCSWWLIEHPCAVLKERLTRRPTASIPQPAAEAQAGPVTATS